MPEEIDGQSLEATESAGATGTGPTQRSGPAKQPSASSAGSTTRVTITSSSLLDTPRPSPAVDAERVRALRDAIASGAYRIDVAAVAKRICRSEASFE